MRGIPIAMTIPTSVTSINPDPLQDVANVDIVSFAPGSQLVRIIDAQCCSLKSFIGPSSVESIGESCFEACYSLSELIFAFPCHLRELFSLPPIWRGSHDIPDSVEDFAF
jgi:hypothetical protein